MERFRLILAGYTIAEAIRRYLLEQGEGHAYEFWKFWRVLKKRTSYQAVRRYFWILKEIGLIEFVRAEPARAPFKKRIYRIIPGMEEDPRWRHPQIELYPDTALGRRYRTMIERGLIPKGGRRAPYR